MATQSTNPVISTTGASVSGHSHSFITTTTHTTNNNNSTVRQLSPRSQNLLFLPDPEEAQTSSSSSVMAGSPNGVQTYSHTQAQSHSVQRLSKENVPVSQTRTSSQSQRQGPKVELESVVSKSINPPFSRPSKKRRLEPYVLVPPGGLLRYEAPLRDADADADADDGVMGIEIGVGDRSFSGDGERQSGTVFDRIGDAVDGDASSSRKRTYPHSRSRSRSRSGTPPHAEEDVTEELQEEGGEEREEEDQEAEGAQELAGPRLHVFLRPSQALTTPSNQLRLRAILKSALEVAEEKVRADVGRYTPPAGSEGLCRVPGRVPNETRGEGRTQRYVSILEDAYGDGDWKRGHRKKPIKMKESLPTVEVPSEDDSESDNESVVSSLVDVGTSGAAHEEEPSDSSSSDPPHPITPPDELLLSASVNVIESGAIAGEEGAVNAQIVVDDEGDGHDHDEEARFSEKKPFAERDSPDDIVPGLQGAPGAPLVPFGAVDSRKLGHSVPVVTTTHPSGADLGVVKRGGGDGGGQRSLDSEGQARMVSSASSSGMVKTISSERRGLGRDSNGPSGRKGGGGSSSSSKGDNSLPRRPAIKSLAQNQDLINDVGKRAGRPSGLAAPPVHHIRWFDTEEWKATFRRLVSGKRRVEIEDLLRANTTIELLEQMVKALPEEAGKKLIDNVAEYLTLMKDLPEGYIPYDDQFGLRKRSADVLRAVSGVN